MKKQFLFLLLLSVTAFGQVTISNGSANFSANTTITVSPAIDISTIKPGDRIDFTFSCPVSVETGAYINLFINGFVTTDKNWVTASYVPGTVLTCSWIIPNDFKNQIGNSVTSFKIDAFVALNVAPWVKSISTLSLQSVKMIQTDLGSLAPATMPNPNNTLLNGKPSVPANSIFRTRTDGITTLAPNNSYWIARIGGNSVRRGFGTSPYYTGDPGIPVNYYSNSKIAADLKSNWTFGYETAPYALPNPANFQYQNGKGPYPFSNATEYPMEELVPKTNSDNHIITVDTSTGWCYELWQANLTDQSIANTNAGRTVSLPYSTSGAKANLSTLTMRTSNSITVDGDSADAAGFMIAPLILEPIEITTAIEQGKTDLGRMLRMTFQNGSNLAVWPANHTTGGRKTPLNLQNTPYEDPAGAAGCPLGAVWRLKSNFAFPTNKLDGSPYVPSQAMVLIVNTLKRYGGINADWGLDLNIIGSPSPVWTNGGATDVTALDTGFFYSNSGLIKATDGEFIDTTWTLLPAPAFKAANVAMGGVSNKHPFTLALLNDGKLIAVYAGLRVGSSFQPSSGVFVYTPGGVDGNTGTWEDVTLFEPTSETNAGMQFSSRDILIDPTDAAQNTWYVGVGSVGGSPSTSALGGLPLGNAGVYRTTDRGANWTKISAQDIGDVYDLKFNPADVSELWVAAGYELWSIVNPSGASPILNFNLNYPGVQSINLFFNPYKSDQLYIATMDHDFLVASMSSTPCVYTLNKTSINILNAGGPTSVVVTPDDLTLCNWNVISDSNWITLSTNATGIGAATVTVNVEANAGADRVGSFSVGGKKVTVNQSATLKVEDFISSKVSLYPNPASDRVEVSLAENARVATPYKLINVNGATVLEGKIEVGEAGKTIALPSLSKGIYIMQLQLEAGIANKKLIIK